MPVAAWLCPQFRRLMRGEYGFVWFQCRLRHCYARNIMKKINVTSIRLVVSMPVAALLCPQFSTSLLFASRFFAFQCRLRHCYARNLQKVKAAGAVLMFQCRLRHCYARNVDSRFYIENFSICFNAGCGIAMPAMSTQSQTSLQSSLSFNAGCGIAMPAISNERFIPSRLAFQCRLRHCYARNVEQYNQS